MNWTVTAVGVTGLTQPSRTFTTLSAFSRDIWDARVLGGLHYDFSMAAGQELGEDVANHVTSRHFRRR